MKMRNQILIGARPERIFSFASATERWPDLLPHYRYVRVLERSGNSRLVEMGARRGWLPVRWRARQINDPEAPAIRFEHVAGWTRGMQVEWRFEPYGGKTLVSIDHALQFRFPLFADAIGRHIIGRFFVDFIASRTLCRMKEVAESSA